MKSIHRQKAFTLVELVTVIAIVVCLAGLLLPVIGAVRQKAVSTACMANLRQIGVAGLLYAADHDQTLPVIEPWPSEPVYSSDAGAQKLLDVLKAYGVTTDLLRCRADLAGPNYYGKEESSYEWCPMANGRKLQSVKLAGMEESLSLAQILMAFDYSDVHDHASNTVYCDGHVAATR